MMRAQSVVTAVALAAVLCAGPGSGHSHVFPTHPEWDDIWPESPFTGEDLETNGLPDLSGVWASMEAGRFLYYFTKSGGGFGTNKDAGNPLAPPAKPGTSYDVKCLTNDYAAKGAGGCGWKTATCALTSEQPTAQLLEEAQAIYDAQEAAEAAEAHHHHRRRRHTHHADHMHDVYVELLAAKRRSGEVTVSATCSFDNGAVLSGPLPADGCGINFNAAPAWYRFCGPLSGLWKGPTGDDYYVLGHNETTGDLVTWWDSERTPLGSWSWGAGTITSSSSVVFMDFHGFNLTGHASADYSSIGNGTWGAPWTKRSQQFFPAKMKTVHLVFMNHYDVGYSDYVQKINNEYLHSYFPKAALLGEEMRALGGTDRFVYVTHPWLLSLFLSCPCQDTNTTDCPALGLNNPLAPPLKCPSPEEVANLTAAVQRGDIVWHAAPFNLQAENMHPALFEAGLLLNEQMGKHFGKPAATVASFRDLIYVSRSTLRLLKAHNVNGLTIGSNGANYPPQVPKLHVWEDSGSNTSMIVMYHPYGYGGYSASSCAGPGMCGDCAEAPNGVALCTEFRTDNTGPPLSTDEIIASLDAVRDEYPGASVFASTFDNFLQDVLPVKDLLPVVKTEIGDTWMYGSPSDPLKMAQNREIQQLWVDCLETGVPECQPTNPTIINMTRFLLKTPEHTWGTPGIGGAWGQGNVYNKTILEQHLNDKGFLAAAATWAEQRFFNELAVQAILEADSHPMAATIRQRVDRLANAKAPDTSHFSKLQDPRAVTTFPAAGVAIGFGEDGGIASLTDLTKGVAWAGPGRELAAVSYATLNESDWVPFCNQYLNSHTEAPGFSKPGSNNQSESAHFAGTLSAVYVDSAALPTRLIAQVAMPDRASQKYGSPSQFFVELAPERVPGGGLRINMTITWLGKTPTMIGESTMVTFNPAQPARRWSIDKLGSPVDPTDVQDGGNQFNHGSWAGAKAYTANGTMNVESMHAPNFNPMTKDFPYGNPLPAGSVGLKQLAPGSVFGMGVNLHNNLWNTNYPTLYPYYDPIYCKDPLSCSNANQLFDFALEFAY